MEEMKEKRKEKMPGYKPSATERLEFESQALHIVPKSDSWAGREERCMQVLDQCGLIPGSLL